jgi:hypothetical protein
MVRTKLSLLTFQIGLTMFLGLLSFGLLAQNFYKENEPKTLSVKIGLGAGTFYAAPRPLIDSLVSQVMPVLSLGVGKHLGSHLSLNSNLSFQSYGNKQYSIDDLGESSIKPLYQGVSYAFEVTPTFNLMPTLHNLKRPKMDFTLGIGIGYLATYRAEKFTFQEKEYTFNFLEDATYIPIRSSISFSLDSWSNLAVEGVFFHTFLEEGNSISSFKQHGNHFAQLNLVYRRLIK